MTLDQISRRTREARRLHAQYLGFVERCEQIGQQAHDLGWQVTYMLNDERSIRGAESLLGIHVRGDFPRSTALSRLIYGF